MSLSYFEMNSFCLNEVSFTYVYMVYDLNQPISLDRFFFSLKSLKKNISNFLNPNSIKIVCPFQWWASNHGICLTTALLYLFGTRVEKQSICFVVKNYFCLFYYGEKIKLELIS